MRPSQEAPIRWLTLGALIAGGALTGATARAAGNQVLFGSPRTVAECQSAYPTTFEAADIDGDGDQDIVTSIRYTWGGAVFYEQLPSGEFRLSTPEIGSPHQMKTVILADIDYDGDLDLFATSYNEAYWMSNEDGHGQFGIPVGVGASVTSTSFKNAGVADIDGDGGLDVVVGSNLTGRLVWNAERYASGVYRCRLETDDQVLAQPLTLVR